MTVVLDSQARAVYWGSKRASRVYWGAELAWEKPPTVFEDFEGTNRYDTGETAFFDVLAGEGRDGSTALGRNASTKGYRQVYDLGYGLVTPSPTFRYAAWVKARTGYDTADLAGLALVDTAGDARRDGYQFGMDVRNGFFCRRNYNNNDGVSLGHGVFEETWYQVVVRWTTAGFTFESFEADGTPARSTTLTDLQWLDNQLGLYLGVSGYSLSAIDDIQFDP